MFQSSLPLPMNNNNNRYSNNSLIPTPNQIWKDFCTWIRRNENLYQCLLKIKHFILDNALLLLLLLLFLLHHFIIPTNY